MSQKVKYRFEFEVSDSWKAGESACWTECPFSPLIGLGQTCKFLTTKELKCPFRDNKFKTLIERDCTVVVDGITISENFAKKRGDEMTDKEIIKALEHCYTEGDTCDNCPFNEFEDCNDILMAEYVIDLIKRQQAEIKELKIENQSLRSAANSYKLHYENAVKNFEEFAQRAYIDNPFACQYCVHLVANGRACLWKEEHEKDGVSCLGKHFKYYSNKMVGDTE